MRRFLSFTLLAFLCLFADVVHASVTVDGITYTTSGTNATVSSVSISTTGTDVVIPETFEYGGTTYTVTALAQKAFNSYTTMTTLTLPSTLTTVGSTAIYKCTALTDIYCYAETPPALASGANYLYSNMSSVSLNLWVPCGCSQAYEDYTVTVSNIPTCVWVTTNPAVTLGEMACESNEEEAVDIDYDSCSPEVNNETAFELTTGEDATFTIAFTGAVKLSADDCYVNEGGGNHGTITLAGVTGTEGDEEGYYTQWTITVSSDIIDTYGPEISIVIAGKDTNGNTLFDEDGGYTIISYYYELVSDEVPELTFDPASDSIVTEIGTITVSSTDGSVTYVSYESEFAVYKDGVESDDYIAWNDEDHDDGSTLVIVVNDGSYSADEGHITEAGTYTITFPGGTFAVDGITINDDITLTYTIEGSSNEESNEGTTTTDGIELTTDDGIVITISSDKITFTHDPISPTWDGYGNGTVVKIYKGDDVVATGTGDGDGEDSATYGNQDYGNYYFDLTASVTEDGTYKLVVPAGVFYLDHNWSTTSAAIEIEFTIGESGSSAGGDEEVSAYGTNLGVMEVGTEESPASYTASDVTYPASYYLTYTPDADGTLYIQSGSNYTVYSDANGENEVSGTGNTALAYTLTGGITYYIVFTTGILWSDVAYSSAWFVATDTSITYDFAIVSIKDANDNDLTSTISNDKIDLATLEDGMEIVIKCTNAEGKYLQIFFGESTDDEYTYLTQTSDRLTPDENGNFTWTGGYDIPCYETYEYPVVCTLYDAEHQGNVVTSATVLTIVGTTEFPVSDVTLESSDPMYDTEEDIEFTSGEDGVITLTFSDYVNIAAEISLGLYGSKDITAEGVENTGDGEGNYTKWTVTIPASELADSDYGGEITISISGTDANGKLLFDESGYNTYTYSYTLVGGTEEEVSVSFDPESGSTVESLKTITVTGVVTDGECTSLTYASDYSSFPIYKDGELSSYELYNDEDALSSDESDEPTTGNQPRDGENSTSDVAELIFSIANVSDPYNEVWNTTITEAGTYTVTLPAGTFKVNNTVYDEAVTLTYTVEGTAANSGLVFDPEGNAIVNSISTVTATYADGTIALAGEASAAYIINVSDNSNVSAANCTIEDGVATITFDPAITEPGTYIVMIPEGYFNLGTGSEDEETVASEKVALTYVIEPVVSLAFDPEDGADIDALETIYVSGVEGDIAVINESAVDVDVYDAEGNVVATAAYDATNSSDEKIAYTITSAITEAGTYTVTFPAETFSVDGTPYRQDVTLTYVIKAISEITYSPAEGTVGPLSSITALGSDLGVNYSVADDTRIEIKDETGATVAYLDEPGYVWPDDDSSEDATGMTFPVVNDDYDAITLSAGTYSITIPAKYLTIGDDAYSEEVTLTYTVIDPTFERVSPADDVITEESISVDDEVIIKSDTQGNMSYQIVDAESGEVAAEGDFKRYEDVNEEYIEFLYQWKAEEEVTLYDGHSYDLIITFTVEGSENVIAEKTMLVYNGLSSEPSKVTLVSVEPDPDYDIDWTKAEDTAVILTFSAPVKLSSESTFIVDLSKASERADEDGNVALKSIEATGDDLTEDGCSTVWTLIVDADDVLYFNGDAIELSVSATDADGATVLFGEDGNEYTLITYDVRIDTGMFTYDPESYSTVESLETIEVSCESGIACSWNVPTDNIYIQNDNTGEIVATATAAEENYDSDDYDDPAYSVTITFAEVTAAGEYTVVIPTDFFIYSLADGSNLNSPRIELHYGIKVATDIDGIESVGVESTEVYNLAGQRVESPVKGSVNIVKYADGSVKKVLQK